VHCRYCSMKYSNIIRIEESKRYSSSFWLLANQAYGCFGLSMNRVLNKNDNDNEVVDWPATTARVYSTN